RFPLQTFEGFLKLCSWHPAWFCNGAHLPKRDSISVRAPILAVGSNISRCAEKGSIPMAMVRSLSARPAPVCCNRYRSVRLTIAIFLGFQISSWTAVAQAPANSAPDVLVLSNGDTLHGKLLNSSGGKITFHSDPLGDVTLDLDKVK